MTNHAQLPPIEPAATRYATITGAAVATIDLTGADTNLGDATVRVTGLEQFFRIYLRADGVDPASTGLDCAALVPGVRNAVDIPLKRPSGGGGAVLKVRHAGPAPTNPADHTTDLMVEVYEGDPRRRNW